MAVTASLSTEVLEGGTIGVVVSFEDDNGDPAVPNTLTYTLRDAYEEIINSKDKETLTPDTSVTVPLYGDDIPAGKVYFIIEGDYDSDLGSGLPLKGYATLNILRLPGA